MKLLVVGGGGREHALAWALRRDDPSIEVFCAPGNPGTAQLASNLPISADDLDGLVQSAGHYGIDLTIVGPEAPLAAGLADRLTASGHPVFGPTAAGARIEASKAFAKDIMSRAGVPTSQSGTFRNADEALAYVAGHAEPLVVKASGLAAGKGAVVCATRAEAEDAVHAMMVDDRFGAAGQVVVVEQFLEGEECSILALTDGKECQLLPISQDHKRLGEGDVGPNTGGMGAYSPVSLISDDLLARIEADVLQPTLQALAREGAPYTGVLYAGLMIDPTGAPSVVEFNCRLGDPEAQVVLPLVTGGLVDCLVSIANGGPPTSIATTGGASVTTVLAAKGYPAAPEKGAAITIPDDLPAGVTVFHAGTRQDEDGVLRVSGGRVLAVTAVAQEFSAAQRMSRSVADRIDFEGKVFRRDIGWREAERRGSGAAGQRGR